MRDHEEERGVASFKLEPSEWVKMTVFVETRSKDKLKSGDTEGELGIETDGYRTLHPSTSGPRVVIITEPN